MGDRNGERLAGATEEVRDAGATVHDHVFDITDRAGFQEAADAFVREAGGVDLVVNNAGVALGGAMGEYTPEDWDWLIGINLTGVFNGCHAFLPVLKQQQSGHFLNVASAAGFVPAPRMTAYCAAKAGVRMMTEVLHNELAPDGIGCTVLMPEFFRTNLHESLRGPDIELATKMITRSDLTAEGAAAYALEAVGKGKLHAVYSWRARLLWRLVRYCPGILNRLVQAEARRLDRKRAAAEARAGHSPTKS